MTSIQAIVEAVRTPVLTVAAASSIPFVVDNSPSDDFAGLWARVSTTVDSAVPVTERDRYRYSGTLSIALFAPRATGDLVVANAAELLVNVYRAWRSASPIVQVVSASITGTSEYADGYAGRVVRVLWTADVLS